MHIRAYYTYTHLGTQAHPRSYVRQLLITFCLNITMHEPKSYTLHNN